MIPATTNWKNAATGSMKPIHQATIYSSSGAVLMILTLSKPGDVIPAGALHYIAKISGGGVKGDVLSGSATNSGLTVEVANIAQFMSTLLAAQYIEGLTLVLSTGFTGLAQADYLPVGTFTIDNITTDKANLRYVLNARDPGMALQRLCYQTGDDGWPTASGHPATVEGNPMEILLAVLSQCLVPAGSINSPVIAAYQNGLFAPLNMKFQVTQPPQGKAIIQQELTSVLAGYAFWNYAGQFTPYFPLPLGAPATPFTLDTHIIKSPVPVFGAGPFVGSMIHMMDYDGSNYDTGVATAYGPAQVLYGLQDLTPKQSRGLKSATGGTLFARLAQYAIFRRYGVKPRTWSPKCTWAAMQLEIGDLVSVTHPYVPARDTGLGMVNYWHEVTGKTPDWDKGEVSLDLLDVNWLNATPLVIAPDGTPNWAGSSPTQQAEYGYVDEGQLVY